MRSIETSKLVNIKKTIEKSVLVVTVFMVFLAGCTTIVDATTSKPLEIDPAERSFGTYLDDKKIQVVVAVNIRKAHPDLKNSHINVNSFNGVVLLTGQVPDAELRTLAAQTASAVNGVRQVHNEIGVTGNIAFLSRTNDTWLATKVKAAFISSPEISDVSIKTVIEDGVVYLMGKVTQATADAAANLASNIGGVKEVVRVFEYIQG